MLQSDRMAAQEPVRLLDIDSFEGSLANRTYQALREAILTLRYRPGEALRKAEICAVLKVSRSPVSDAISRLASEGLVVVVPQAGTYVARFSLDDIREGAFLREAIETAAVERVATTISEDQIRLLRRSLTVQSALIKDEDIVGFYLQDAAMHALILSFTGFRRLAQVSETAWVNVDRARQLLLPLPGRIAETLQEHQAIVEALSDRDPDRARHAMRHHLGQLMTRLVPLEVEHPDLFDSN